MVRLFRRYFLVFATVTAFSLVAGFFITKFISQSFRPPRPPPLFIAKTIEAIDPHNRVGAIGKMIEMLPPDRRDQWVLLDAEGVVLYPANKKNDLDWAHLKKPTGDYGYIRLGGEDEGPGQSLLVRFPGEPAQYLWMEGRPDGPGLPIVVFATALACSLIGIAIALWFIFHSMKQNVLVADKVIADLKNGNLKARLPITGDDDISQSMMRFNQMASEIESLVERLHTTEEARTRLLQELTHDLKTPVASLKSMLETLSRGGDGITVQVRSELLALSLREVDYFARLVDDLLFLAQVSEPRYRAEKMMVSVTEILSDEADDASARQIGPSKIKLNSSLMLDEVSINGDPHLLKRLFRNVLDNAFSFANTQVTIGATVSDGKVIIKITDDGGGFSKDALEAFGRRRITRVEKKETGGRISIGLGSVIALTIAELHRGRVIAQNVDDSKSAQVLIELPI